MNGDFETGPVGLGVLVIGSIIALVASILLTIVVKRHFKAMLRNAGESVEENKGKERSVIKSEKSSQIDQPDEESIEENESEIFI